MRACLTPMAEETQKGCAAIFERLVVLLSFRGLVEVSSCAFRANPR